MLPIANFERKESYGTELDSEPEKQQTASSSVFEHTQVDAELPKKDFFQQ
jgi:hypothetical protein